MGQKDDELEMPKFPQEMKCTSTLSFEVRFV